MIPRWTRASRHAVVSGWIPLELQLEAWTGPDAAALLLGLDGRTDALLQASGFRRSGQERIAVRAGPANGQSRSWRSGRQVPLVGHHIRVQATLGGSAAKEHIYRESVRAGIADLVAAVRNGHDPLVTTHDAWQSIAPPAFPGTVKKPL